MLPTWTTLPNGSQHGAWIFLLAFFQATVFLTTASHVPAMSAKEKRQLRDQVKDMFLHGNHSYMDNAFPADELVRAQKEVELDLCWQNCNLQVVVCPCYTGAHLRIVDQWQIFKTRLLSNLLCNVCTLLQFRMTLFLFTDASKL